MRRVTLFAVVFIVVLSGCTLPASPDRFDTDRDLGHVGDYTADDTFEFDDRTHLTESQLEAVAYRSMARIEVLRGLKFEHDVEVEVISRAEYREQRGGRSNASAFRNELWRGAFVVDGETDVNSALDDLYGESVRGYYANDRIVLVADDTSEIRIDRGTLVHELVHALQDQHFGLERRGSTIDERRAELGVLEGEANYVPHLYEQRCGEAWQCIPDYEQPVPEPDDRPFNPALFLSIYAPYAEGPSFVAHLHETGDWDAVDRAHDDRPASTSQLIHPERYPDAEPVAVDVADRSSDDWEPYAGGDGEPRTETVGEATLFATLWANGVLDRSLTEGGTELAPYNYSHSTTEGWAGDTFRAYHDEDDRTAHVWALAWESEEDAETFADAYRELLEANGAEPVDDDSDRVETDAETVDNGTDVYRIGDDDPFAGAYRITVTNERVEIVGAPAVDELEAVHAAADDIETVHGTEPAVLGSADTAEPSSPAAPIRPSTSSALWAESAPADG
ncbi:MULTISPECIES: Hvo_1808 family surface protein [Natrialbaceae]|uniref:Hvo_1808 family surface protein n=1 Tax=Natrialbaceae TaxID=1644061 RepID=UPI00207C7A96|nr:Hvo_1808 family surface protein [Natronococcus sp. CG52]